ncbi:hypothetical protein ER308_07130 [Egibacter rhizosphaerae]|uniref:Large polyvalent protein associated domain-containing protein n=1 Tax=Egibacter rhizosphaerae TaxID=1670831 RepID=A0A411YDM7_9ACTN|nr:hypothetical protein [Egibacter rhizosphaerae]QBI19339.1 hypothetical protein ER308_07130 [Egibacter rhizosphaerae]
MSYMGEFARLGRNVHESPPDPDEEVAESASIWERGWDRTTDFFGGLSQGAIETGGFFVDMAHATPILPGFEDEDFHESLWSITQERLLEGAMGEMFGPDRGVGAAIGAVPERVREPVGEGFDWMMENIYEPWNRAHAATHHMQNLSEDQRWHEETEDLGLFEGLSKQWQAAWDLAESASPGQALGARLTRTDITDPDDVAELMGSDAFRFWSGTYDAVSTLTLEPDVIGASWIGSARRRYLKRPLDADPQRRAVQREEFFTGRGKERGVFRASWRDMDDFITRRLDETGDAAQTAGEIRRRFFQGDPHGEFKSWALASLPNKQSREQAMRLFMGDMSQLRALDRYSQDLELRVAEATSEQRDLSRLREQHGAPRPGEGAFQQPAADRLTQWQAQQRRVTDEIQRRMEDYSWPNEIGDPWFRDLAHERIKNDQVHQAGLDAELRYLDVENEMLQQWRRTAGSQQHEPRLSRLGDARDAVTRGRMFQEPGSGRVLNMFTKRPHRQIDLEDGHHVSTMVERTLRQARMSRDEIDRWVGAFNEPMQAGQRFELWNRMEQAAFRKVARDFGVNEADMGPIMEKMATGREQARRLQQSGRSEAFAAGDRDLIRFAGPDGEISVYPAPMAKTQTRNFTTATDFPAVLQAMRRLEKKGFTPPADPLPAGVLGRARTLMDQTIEGLEVGTDLRGRLKRSRRAMDQDTDAPRYQRRMIDDALDDLEDWAATNPDAGDVILPEMQRLREEVGALPDPTQARRRMEGTRRLGREAAEGLNYFWKANVLLRPAWPMRVVADQNMRNVFKFGALATAGQMPRAGANMTRAAMRELGVEMAPHSGRGQRRATQLGVAGGAGTGFAAAGPAGAAVGAAIGGFTGRGLHRKLSDMDAMGYKGPVVGGARHEGPFGAAGDASNIYRERNRQMRQIQEVMGSEETLMRRLEPDPRNMETVQGTDPRHADSWARNVNNQVGGDEFWSQALRGIRDGETPSVTMERMVDWLDSPDGAAYRRSVPWRDDVDGSGARVEVPEGGEWVNLDRETWAAHLYDEAQRLVDGNPELADKALHRTLQANDIETAIPDAALRPEVHGEAIAQLAGQGVMGTVNTFVKRGMRFLGTLVDDELSRMPSFSLHYNQRLRELHGGVPEGQRISRQQLDAWEGQARDYALSQTRELMFDLAERSQFGEMVRFQSQFFDAFREITATWAGLVADNPAAAVRAMKSWEGLTEYPGFHEDDEGNRWIDMRVPDFAQGLLNESPLFQDAVDSQGYMRLSPRSLAVAPVVGGPEGVQGMVETMAGFGPWIQIPASELVRRRPEFEDVMSPILPFGPSRDIPDALMSSWQRDMRGYFEGYSDDRYASNFQGILRTKLTEMRLGEREPVDFDDPEARRAFVDEVESEATSLQLLDALTSFAAPASPQFDSPFRPYIDRYQELQREDPATADSRFYETFGDEFFALTQNFTESMDGVPATQEGWVAGEQYRAFAEEHPDLFPVILGSGGGGSIPEFSRAVYDAQMDSPLRFGAEETRRRRFTPDEMIEDTDVRAGRIKFSRLMDRIDSELERRGLPHLDHPDAEPIARARSMVVDQVEQQHPEWRREREQMDRGRWRERIRAFDWMTRLEPVNQRPDIQGLDTYLELRDRFIGELEQREVRSLTARANEDLHQAWQHARQQLIQQNPAFADLAHRYLEFDTLEPGTSRQEAAQ